MIIQIFNHQHDTDINWLEWMLTISTGCLNTSIKYISFSKKKKKAKFIGLWTVAWCFWGMQGSGHMFLCTLSLALALAKGTCPWLTPAPGGAFPGSRAILTCHYLGYSRYLCFCLPTSIRLCQELSIPHLPTATTTPGVHWGATSAGVTLMALQVSQSTDCPDSTMSFHKQTACPHCAVLILTSKSLLTLDPCLEGLYSQLAWISSRLWKRALPPPAGIQGCPGHST